MPRDPVCGMTVDEKTAIKRKIGDRTYYFCSETCASIYEQPELELKKLRRRVTMTLLGVIAVGLLRVLVLFGVVATIMSFTLIGGLRIYGLALFIVSTPVVWVAGWGVIYGAYKALRNRSINMDVLITTGVLAGWTFGAVNAFIP